jgi:hypothetical protein
MAPPLTAGGLILSENLPPRIKSGADVFQIMLESMIRKSGSRFSEKIMLHQ